MTEGTHATEVIKRVESQETLPAVAHEHDKYLSVVERLAADPNVDIDKLQKIIDMKNREEDRSAEQAFNADMVAAQSEIKVAVKNKKNQQTHSEYADLTSLITSAKPIYTKYGFALSFYPGDNPPDGYVRVMVDVMHRMGHSKTRHYDSPIDRAGIAGKVNKTNIHAEASSFTYGRRYLTASTFNIPTGDDDGNAATAVQYVIGKELNQLNNLKKFLRNENKFLELLGAESFDAIPASKFNQALSMLNEARVARAKKPAAKKPAPAREPGQEG